MRLIQAIQHNWNFEACSKIIISFSFELSTLLRACWTLVSYFFFLSCLSNFIHLNHSKSYKLDFYVLFLVPGAISCNVYLPYAIIWKNVIVCERTYYCFFSLTLLPKLVHIFFYFRYLIIFCILFLKKKNLIISKENSKRKIAKKKEFKLFAIACSYLHSPRNSMKIIKIYMKCLHKTRKWNLNIYISI